MPSVTSPPSARPRRGGGGRWGACWGALAALSAGLVAPAPGAVPAAPAAGCPDAEVVFARGTSEPPGLGRVGQAFVDALRAQASGHDIGAYAVNYAASRLQLHGGDGANDVIAHVEQMAGTCPATRLVLGGYSQGATVIDIAAGVPLGGVTWGGALPDQYADNVAAVAVFGNAANRLGGSLPTQSPLLGSKAIDLCHPTDPICQAGLGNRWESHTDGYIPELTTRAAVFAAGRIQAGPPEPVPAEEPN